MRVAVKICGVTDVAGALLSAELGADYLGLNFWPGSPRCLGVQQAREIAMAVRAAAPRVSLVGVFVNPDAAAVEATAAAVGLDLVQFSGDEPPAVVRQFAARALKALRAPDAAAALAYGDCWGLLLDSPAGAVLPGELLAGQAYGGTGRAWDYAAGVAAISGRAAGEPGGEVRRLFLAGGLGPANVRRVVASLRPFAVDVCSGVEAAPGRKDPRLLRQLFEEVRNGQVTSAP
ncbi:MAG TPA: phosphoribosylanthranilate isomerase [Thermoanaerobaculia bacterium]|jgi:phosphoribosylanthranilate isomerase|nr:phosphoribosylanthranilate isomerase [Thermoanaerobaculia bacterium]